MTRIYGQASPSFTPPLATRSQALMTGMSFDEALRTSEAATNRMFGFEELGMLGLSRSTNWHLDVTGDAGVPGPSTSGRLEVAVESAPTVRDDQLGHRLTTDVAATQAYYANRAISADSPFQPDRPTETLSLDGRSAESSVAFQGAEAGQVDPLISASHDGPELGRTLIKPVPTSTKPVRTKVTVIIEEDRVIVIARDPSLSEEHRASIEARTDALVRKFGLAATRLTLNGLISFERFPYGLKE